MLIETEFQWKKELVEECENEIVQLRIEVQINCGIICVLNEVKIITFRLSVILNHQNTTKDWWYSTTTYYTHTIKSILRSSCNLLKQNQKCMDMYDTLVTSTEKVDCFFSYHGSFQKRALWTWWSDPYPCAEQSPDGDAPPHILEPELRVEFLSVTAPVCILHLRSDRANKQMINNRSRYTHTCINYFLNPVTKVIQ